MKVGSHQRQKTTVLQITLGGSLKGPEGAQSLFFVRKL